MVLVEARHREHWGITRYADELGLSPERLNRLTRAETGQGPLDLVHARLAREACRRLTYVAAPISKLSNWDFRTRPISADSSNAALAAARATIAGRWPATPSPEVSTSPSQHSAPAPHIPISNTASGLLVLESQA